MNYMNTDSKKEHSIMLIDRSRMELTGIEDVEGFTDDSVSATCPMGDIAIDGEGLKIESFGREVGKLVVTGKIESFCYYEKSVKRKGLFSRNK